MQATDAANSVFIGRWAGFQDTVNNTAVYNDSSTFANTSILIGHRTSTAGFSNSIAIGAYATNTATNQMMIGSSTRRIETLVFNGGTGNTCAVNASTGISCSSDERLKTNIEDIPNVLDSLTNIRTVSYNWKTNPNGTQMLGFIAQNLNDYFPELISQNIDGMYSVNYAGMTPILTRAVQEMNLNMVGIGDLERENSWRESLVSWFASASNGIRSLVVKDKVCVDDQCLTNDDIRELLEMKNSLHQGGGDIEPDIPEESDEGGDEEPVVPAPAPEDIPTEPEPEVEPVLEPEVESEPEPQPEPAPEVEEPAPDEVPVE